MHARRRIAFRSAAALQQNWHATNGPSCSTKKASGTGYLEGERGGEEDRGLGNQYYVYGGTWKACTGMTKSEIADSAAAREGL